MKEPVFSKDLRARLETMSPPTFWALVFFIWLFTQMGPVGIPFRFLATWVHEMGHGIGAIISGGDFTSFIVTPNLSGVAKTNTSNNTQRLIVLFLGLLGPSMTGGLMLILTRRYKLGHICVFIIASALLISGVIWAGNVFSRITLIFAGLILAVIVIRGSRFIQGITAYIIAISLCLNALTDFGYFFMKGGNIAGVPMMSDTSHLREILGGPHLMWASIVAGLTLLILYAAFRFSGTLKSD
jgi:hypothetical protein